MNFLFLSFLSLALFFPFVMFLFFLVMDYVCSVLKVKSDRELEVKLNSTTLMLSAEDIKQFDIDFRTIESSVTFIELVGTTKLLKTFFELLLS